MLEPLDLWYALEYDDVLVMGISGCVSALQVIVFYLAVVEFHTFQPKSMYRCLDGFFMIMCRQAIVIRPSLLCCSCQGSCHHLAFVVRPVKLVRLLSSGRRRQAIVIRPSSSGRRHQAVAVRQSLGGQPSSSYSRCQAIVIRPLLLGHCHQAIVVKPLWSGRCCQAVIVRTLDKLFKT